MVIINTVGWAITKDGTLTHCDVPAIWKDCIGHSGCYYAECNVCGFKTPPDCNEIRKER